MGCTKPGPSSSTRSALDDASNAHRLFGATDLDRHRIVSRSVHWPNVRVGSDYPDHLTLTLPLQDPESGTITRSSETNNFSFGSMTYHLRALQFRRGHWVVNSSSVALRSPTNSDLTVSTARIWAKRCCRPDLHSSTGLVLRRHRQCSASIQEPRSHTLLQILRVTLFGKMPHTSSTCRGAR